MSSDDADRRVLVWRTLMRISVDDVRLCRARDDVGLLRAVARSGMSLQSAHERQSMLYSTEHVAHVWVRLRLIGGGNVYVQCDALELRRWWLLMRRFVTTRCGVGELARWGLRLSLPSRLYSPERR